MFSLIYVGGIVVTAVVVVVTIGMYLAEHRAASRQERQAQGILARTDRWDD